MDESLSKKLWLVGSAERFATWLGASTVEPLATRDKLLLLMLVQFFIAERCSGAESLVGLIDEAREIFDTVMQVPKQERN